MSAMKRTRIVPRMVHWAAMSLALSWGSWSFAASTAGGSAYGLKATANLAGIGLDVPIGSTGDKTAPPDFNATGSTVNAAVNAGVLAVSTGVINYSTRSTLTQNDVTSSASVDGLKLSVLLNSILGASVVKSEARMTCEAGKPAASGSTTIVGGTGILEGVGVSANSTVSATIPLLLGDVSVTLHINEQTITPNSISVNAVRVELATNLLGYPALTTNVVIGHSEASMSDCAPTVTLAALPPIGTANQLAVPVSGTCSAGSGNVTFSSAPTGVSQSLACTSSGTFQGTINAQSLPDGNVSITASQTASGKTATDSQSTTKNTAVAPVQPVVTIGSAPSITSANQSSYSVSGTCSANGVPVSVSVAGAAASATCSGGTWLASGINVSGVPDGSVTVTASQTVGGLTGSGTYNTNKDATAPAVTVTTAPAITSANQSAYGVAGTCTENGAPVTVRIGSITVYPAPVCNGGSWSASGVDVGALPSGTVTITASQTDAAGNTGSGTRTTNKASAASAVTVTTAPPINASNQNRYTGVSGTCSATDGSVSIRIGSVTTTADCQGGSWTAPSTDVSQLPDGVVTITASQTVNGAVISGSRTTEKDASPPSVGITTAPTIDEGNQSSYSASGTCTSGDGKVRVSIGNITVEVDCVNGTWSVTGVNVGSLPKGSVTISASQTDGAGNTGSATRQIDKTSDADGSAKALIVPQNGTWAISDEINGNPGRGMGIDVQDGVLFMQVYNYTNSGAPTFHIAVGKLSNNTTTMPLVYYKGGRYFGSAALDGQQAGAAGSVEVTFTSRTTGTIRFPGESAKPMQRYNYESTPAQSFSDPSLVDRWAMVELDANNQPVSTWWADIGTSDQVRMNHDWAGVPSTWPYGSDTQIAVHGFDGTLTAPVFAACSYSGSDYVFACSGTQGSASVTLRLQRSLDQLSGTVRLGQGDTRRIIGTRITRAAYTVTNGQPALTTYYRPDHVPEPGTWAVKAEVNGKPGRGMTMDVQRPTGSGAHMLFMSVYDYERDGSATFHSAYGVNDASTIPDANTPELLLSQYHNGRYFGGPERIATSLGNSGSASHIDFVTSSIGTIQFPGEGEVQTERFYFGIDANSIQSLLGSWAVLSHSGAMKSLILNLKPYGDQQVTDQATGYVCSKEPLRQFNFRCAPPAASEKTPVIRFGNGYFFASRGIVGDGGDTLDATPELAVMRITTSTGESTQAGPMFPGTR